MAFPSYMKVQGTRQGEFKGNSAKPARSGWTDCLDFELEVDSPRDPATAQPSGKRQWKPISVVKKWSAALPQFLQALATNETLSSVVIEFDSVLPTGIEKTFCTIRLTNASVAQFRQYIDSVHQDELERVSFVFQTITLTYSDGTSASDNWSDRT